MRILMWFTIGFTAACAAGTYIKYGLCIVAAIACAVVMFSLLPFSRKFLKKAIYIMIGCAIGISWFLCVDHYYLAPVRDADGQAMLLRVTVTAYSQEAESGVSVQGKTEINGRTYRVLYYTNPDIQLAPGDRIEGGFRLRYTGVGAEKPTYHQGSGIFLLLSPKGANEIIKADSVPQTYFTAKLHKQISDLLNKVFPTDTRAFARGIFLGDTSGVPFGMERSLKNSGIYHIFAVSGMHVSILVALIYLMCGQKRWIAVFVGTPILILFAGIVGFSPSIVRACIMHILMMIALASDVEFDPPTALATAVLVLLAVNPLSITSVGFQLTVGCILGIFFFAGKIHKFLLSETRLGPAKGKSLKARLTRWFVGSVSMSVGAVALITPVVAIYFGNISVMSVVTNLLVLWLVPLIFYGVIGACVLGALWLPLGIGLGWVISWPIRFVLCVSEIISSIPLSAVFTCSVYVVAWIVFAYILIFVFIRSKKKQPIVLICCLIVGLIGTVSISWIEPRTDSYRLTVVDVGQGQCLILQYEDKCYVVDCGGDSGDLAANTAAQLLMSQGVFRLDGFIVTHYDTDHCGGAAQLLSVIPADVLYLPVLDGDDKIRDDLEQRYGERIVLVDRDILLDDTKITIFTSLNTQDNNDSSLCILFQPENCDILITGDRSEDGERELMEHTSLPDVEILIAGHHGSAESTSWELLNVTRPEIVIISVGKDNRYGHPKEETLERLRLFGCGVYRTDLEGTIIFRG